MMWCGRTKKAVATGIDIPYGSPLTGYAQHKFTCEACGHVHAARNLFYERDPPLSVDRHWVALDLVPDIAAEIGILVSMFALIEFYMPWLFEGLTRSRSTDSAVVMGYFKSFGDKIELLEWIIKTRLEETDTSKAIKLCLPNLKEANSLRNKYVHARLSLGAHDELHLEPFAADVRRKPRTEIKSLEQVAEDVRRMRTIAYEAAVLAVKVRNEPGFSRTDD
jgi:hypothetical protein